MRGATTINKQYFQQIAISTPVRPYPKTCALDGDMAPHRGLYPANWSLFITQWLINATFDSVAKMAYCKRFINGLLFSCTSSEETTTVRQSKKTLTQKENAWKRNFDSLYCHVVCPSVFCTHRNNQAKPQAQTRLSVVALYTLGMSISELRTVTPYLSLWHNRSTQCNI